MSRSVDFFSSLYAYQFTGQGSLHYLYIYKTYKYTVSPKKHHMQMWRPNLIFQVVHRMWPNNNSSLGEFVIQVSGGAGQDK